MSGRFKIIPVLDLMDGVVVRGVKGERARYRPVEGLLSPTAELYDVAAAFYHRYGFREFYAADLDAIMSGGKRNQSALLSGLREKLPGLFIAVDYGAEDAAGLCYSGADQIIIGTETLRSLKAWAEMRAPLGRIIASIDVDGESVLSASAEIARLRPEAAVRALCRGPVKECILLCLSRVGTGAGLNRELILDCARAAGEQGAKLYLGGGISSLEDLRWLAEQGVAGALVASLFHDTLPAPETIWEITGVLK